MSNKSKFIREFEQAHGHYRMYILRATVLLTRHGPDKVMLHTSLQCPTITKALPSQPPLELDFNASHGTGVEYCRQVFGIDPEIIDVC